MCVWFLFCFVFFVVSAYVYVCVILKSLLYPTRVTRGSLLVSPGDSQSVLALQ